MARKQKQGEGTVGRNGVRTVAPTEAPYCWLLGSLEIQSERASGLGPGMQLARRWECRRAEHSEDVTRNTEAVATGPTRVGTAGGTECVR